MLAARLPAQLSDHDAATSPRYHRTVEFEWDAKKAALNAVKHNVRFDEAITVFSDPLEMTISDQAHAHEARFVSVGRSESGRLIVVTYTEREESVRIISARAATPKERRQYESTS